MIHIVFGALAMAVFFLLWNYVKREGLEVKWWQWLLTILGLIYGVFVLEVIYGFLIEGHAQASLVMGVILALVAVVWGVLMGRFVFTAPAKA